jgi:hypothetical protein
VLRSSGETTLWVHKDSAEAQESKNPLRIQKEKILGGTMSWRTQVRLKAEKLAEKEDKGRGL